MCYHHTIYLRKTKVKKAKDSLRHLSDYFAYWKKNEYCSASTFHFKKLSKVHHGTAYKQGHVQNPYSITNQEREPLFNYENFMGDTMCTWN